MGLEFGQFSPLVVLNIIVNSFTHIHHKEHLWKWYFVIPKFLIFN